MFNQISLLKFPCREAFMQEKCSFFNTYLRNPYALRIQKMYMVWVQQIFDPILVVQSWVSATKCGPLAKL